MVELLISTLPLCFFVVFFLIILYTSEERLRRAGKNPKRVGADFHLKVAAQKQDSDDW